MSSSPSLSSSSPLLSLKDLASSPHPTMETRRFSIHADPATRRASRSSVCYHLDLDGIVLASRHLDAFQVCHCGEARVQTTCGQVLDKSSFLEKNDIFDSDVYDSHHLALARYMPGFAFVSMPGGTSLQVVGILNPRADVQEAERCRASPSLVRKTFFTEVLNRAILALPTSSRTRTNNLALTASITGSLPEYYRLYKEDICELSCKVRDQLRALPSDSPYWYHFVYHKYGQQIVLGNDGPPTLQSTQLDLLVADVNHLECAGVHIAVNFSARDPENALFWDAERTGAHLRGQQVHRFPFMGLTEVGNTTCRYPRWPQLLDVWDNRGVHVTHSQAYTPAVKPMGTHRPFALHPFLLSYLLGRDYVASRRELFSSVVRSTDRGLDVAMLKEALTLNLANNRARFEVAVTSRGSLASLLNFQPSRYARRILRCGLLVEVSSCCIASPSTACHLIRVALSLPAGPKDGHDELLLTAHS